MLWKADDGTTGTMNYPGIRVAKPSGQTFNITEPGQITRRRGNTLLEAGMPCRAVDGRKWRRVAPPLPTLRTLPRLLRTSGGSRPSTTSMGGTSFAGYENANGSVPQAEDKVVCLGSQADTTRTGAVQITAGTATIGHLRRDW